MLPELLVDAKGPDGCFWPEADLPATPGDVCFPVKCGLNILAASISGFDPNRKRAGVYPLPVKWLPVSTAVNSYITVCMMLAWCTIRCGGRLDTSMEDDQAGAHASRPPEQPAHLDLLDDDREAQPVIERVGDPAVTFRDVSE